MSSDYTFTDQVGHLLRKAYQRHLAIFQQNVGDSQLTAVHFVTLCALRDNGPCSISELVKLTAVDQATIRGIVDRLRARQLISLGHDELDKRKVIVSLTDAGRVVVRSALPKAIKITELTLQGLNPAELVAISFLLGKMVEDSTN
ncbi:MarR family transcriptional regulator (plasmid) [Pseudomonas sp. BYT-5]|uniref:MarR family winged helix-turn-helix transcriptional regulator n=1 Tax=Pseudomonas sp. BYT-5 TaxID=2944392 RepID=UPI0020224C9D|nr:MarR family transcriptional regulator [Pseudomonas sp. BYT-5]URD45384.1 MarR family transcriptional regulator [Pseudomonas sp. BYT-5]